MRDHFPKHGLSVKIRLNVIKGWGRGRGSKPFFKTLFSQKEGKSEGSSQRTSRDAGGVWTDTLSGGWPQSLLVGTELASYLIL